MKVLIIVLLLILSITISCELLTDSLKTSHRWYQQRKQQDDITYYAIFFSDEHNGWISTWNGTGGLMITEYPVIITNDGGLTWFPSDSLKDGELGLRCVPFINENTGWVAGSDNVYKTGDGGKHWTLDFTPASGHLGAKDMFFINEHCGWIISWDGTIFKYECY